MSKLILSLILGCTFQFAVVAQKSEISSRAFDAEIRALSEKIRDILRNGNERLGIPSFNPLKIQNLPLDLSNSLITGNLHLSNLTLKGLPAYELKEGKVDISIITASGTLILELGLGTLELNSDYNGNLKLFNMIHLFGKGKLNIILQNLGIQLKVTIKVLGKKRITNVSINLNLPSTHANITGLLDNPFMSDVISKQLSDTLTTLASEEEARISKIVQDAAWYLVETYINPILGDLRFLEEDIQTNEAYIQAMTMALEETVAVIMENRTYLKMLDDLIYKINIYGF